MNANERIQESSKRHILTVLLEDYFHVEAFSHLIERGKHYRFQTRYEQNTLKALDVLERFQIKATFFVLGCIAEENPAIVREVAARGHEIASRGFYHRALNEMSDAEFRADLRRAREALERASGTQVKGYRAAHKWTDRACDWALRILAEEDYAYDASLMPTARAVKANPESRFAHAINFDGKRIWEFPVSTFQLPTKHLLPIGGGNYMRQFPHALVRRAVRHWTEHYSAPFILYFHVWELDPVQPRIASADALTRVRHYRNLNKMAWVLDDYFRHYQFTSIADYLNLKIERSDANAAEHRRESLNVLTAPSPEPINEARGATPPRTPITVIVPCFNEQLILPYLANTLRSVEAKLSDAYAVNFVFVDDCSTDGTWTLLQQLFSGRTNCQLVRHDANKGVAAAIMTGAHAAQTDIVCSIDCDCTYDPHELRKMIPLLTGEVEMVTASPYHPQGAVLNVPAWRLKLSQISSFLYRRVLRQKLYTYTSCFRVYRRRALLALQIEKGGFLGVAEMLGKLDLRGGKIAEFPATLEVRLFGQSKMRVARTIVGHLGLLARLLVLRLQQERARTAHEGSESANDYQASPLLKERK